MIPLRNGNDFAYRGWHDEISCWIGLQMIVRTHRMKMAENINYYLLIYFIVFQVHYIGDNPTDRKFSGA